MNNTDQYYKISFTGEGLPWVTTNREQSTDEYTALKFDNNPPRRELLFDGLDPHVALGMVLSDKVCEAIKPFTNNKLQINPAIIYGGKLKEYKGYNLVTCPKYSILDPDKTIFERIYAFSKKWVGTKQVVINQEAPQQWMNCLKKLLRTLPMTTKKLINS